MIYKVMEWTSSSKTILQVINIINSGNLKKYLRSEKVEEGRIMKENNVYRLVGDNFDNFISNQDKWTIVFFTRKKCSMCDEVKLVNNLVL